MVRVRFTRKRGAQISRSIPEDWIKEVAVMGDIYKLASLFIAADARRNCKAGIFESNVHKHNIQYPVKLPLHQSSQTLQISKKASGFGSWFRVSIAYPQYLRYQAWTFQKSVLSARPLSLTSREMECVCREEDSTEFCSSLNTGLDLTEYQFTQIVALSPSWLRAELVSQGSKRYTISLRVGLWLEDTKRSLLWCLMRGGSRPKGVPGAYMALDMNQHH